MNGSEMFCYISLVILFLVLSIGLAVSSISAKNTLRKMQDNELKMLEESAKIRLEFLKSFNEQSLLILCNRHKIEVKK